MDFRTVRLKQNPDFVCRGSPDRPAHQRQWYETPRGDGRPEAWCYTDRLSYGPGEDIIIHAIATAARADLELWSDGLVPIRLWAGSAATAWAETAADASVVGCGWPEIARIPVRHDWPSCVCRLILKAGDGALAEHLVAIRAGRERAPRAVLLLADGTWNAYNDWGGSNHYEGIIEADSARFSPEISVQRPFARGMVSLPPEAPRTVPDAAPEAGAPRYPHMEWAWANGYSKKYASAGWACYERFFVHWAEAQGYQLDFLSQRDLHRDPTLLDGVPCVICVGHDEYWSLPMREAIDNYVENGGRVGRFAGNFMWQIRISDDGSRQICHKYLAREEDPLFGTERAHLTTGIWEAPEIGYPGRATFGLDVSAGMYAGFGGLAPRGSGGFTLYREDHWAFDGTRLGYGDVLGGQSRIFGYEVDGLRYRIEDGLPFPEPADGLPADLTILGLGLARIREDPDPGVDTLFVGDEDARYVAEILYGRTDEETLSRVNRGSGMIVHFTRGKGEVFHAGATEWLAGLIRGDRAVEQVTRNVLNRFGVASED
ncbi:MAG: hypothetical protein KDJ16_03860 [Hyphomicrobiales bacterium]|nr:hypothetical protein [Hyphomicrobiales bacterium]